MTAIVGIDAAVLFAPVNDAVFVVDSSYHIPAATELPRWRPEQSLYYPRSWDWGNPTGLDETTPVLGSVTLTDGAVDTLTPDISSYSASTDITFELIIDGTGTPDTFKWRKAVDDAAPGAWTTTVSISGTAQALSDGVTVLFGSTTGHALNQRWYFKVYHELQSPWIYLPERNEVSLSISVDVAEHKPFVTSLNYAWVDKGRTWMSWSGSFSGYYTDSNDTIFNTMKAGQAVWMCMFDSRAVATLDTPAIPDKAWLGKVLLTSVDHTTGSEDFSTLDVDFDGLDPLYRVDQT